MRYNYFLAYVTAFSGTGRQEEEDGKTLVCDKWDRAINWLFCRDCQLKLRFSGLLQKDLLKGNWSWAKSCFKQNYCHACHTRFAVFFPLPSCCVSSLIMSPRGVDLGNYKELYLQNVKRYDVENLHISLFLRDLLLDGDKTLKVLAILEFGFLWSLLKTENSTKKDYFLMGARGNTCQMSQNDILGPVYMELGEPR